MADRTIKDSLYFLQTLDEYYKQFDKLSYQQLSVMANITDTIMSLRAVRQTLKDQMEDTVFNKELH